MCRQAPALVRSADIPRQAGLETKAPSSAAASSEVHKVELL